MIEYNQAEQGEIPNLSEFGVKVIGVGGAGANVLDRMALEGSDEAKLLTLNTDVRALTTSVSADKVQLGTTLLKGMGTGGDPSLGKQAALEAVDEIREAVRGHQIVFVCVGLGGGTGSGAAPEVCRIVKEEGVFLVVFATMPFSFEGQRRMDQAKDALETISRYSNAVITFDNDRMGELIVPKDGVTQAFAAADKIISQSIRATMNVVFRPGIIRIGMDDLLSALNSTDSRCLFGYGMAKGENRPQEALEQALKCPLLDRGKLLNEAKSVLVQVAGGETMTLFEVQLVMTEVAKHVGEETQILFGTGTDKRLGNSLSVTIISSIAGPNAEASVESSAPGDAADQSVSLGMSAGSGVVAGSVLSQPAPAPAVAAPAPEPAAPAPVTSKPDPVPAEPEPAKEEAPATPVEEPAVYEDLASEPEVETPVAEEEPEPELPAYSPPVLPDVEVEEEVAGVAASAETSDDMRNPIARAMDEQSSGSSNGSGEASGAEVDRVEAVTDSSQKITLSRMVSSGNTGRIKTRDPKDGPSPGPALPPTKPPAAQPAPEPSEEVKQQQEMLQLEPVDPNKKGRFAKTDPTIVDGEDLDVPTFLRKSK